MNGFRKRIGAVCFSIWATVATASAAADLYGAIAYSPATRSYGWSKDFATQTEAESAAMTECAKRAGDCRTAVWFVNACGALAVGPQGWGAEWGENFNEAQRKSTRLCSDYSNGCEILVTQCVAGR